MDVSLQLDRIDWNGLAEEATDHLAELVRRDTRNPPGGETEAARYVAGVLSDEGLAPEVLEPEPGRGSVVCRLEGQGGGGLLLTSHLDVAPVEEEAWSRDPFGAEIVDGELWGRGAIDAKAQVAQMLTVVLLLRRLGIDLAHDLVLAGVADEERGGGLGMGWLVEEHPGLLQSSYAICEVGGAPIPAGDRWLYPVQVAEKGRAVVRMVGRGEGGHPALPRTGTAVARLVDALGRLGESPLAHRTTHASRALVAALSESQGFGTRIALEGLLLPQTFPLALRAIPEEETRRWLRAMFHDLATPTVLGAGDPESPTVIGREAEALLDCRFVPGASVDDVLEAIRERVGDAVDLEVVEAGDPIEFPTDTPLFDAISRTVARCDPDGRAVPYLMVGSTDAKHLARLGIITYGFFPVRLSRGAPISRMVHGPDERVPLDAFADGLRMMGELVLDFCLP